MRKGVISASEETERNPLDTSFGPHSRRGEQLRRADHGRLLEIADSAFTHLTLSTVSNLARIAEQHPQALRFFPEGSRLVLSAQGERGDYASDGYLIAYVELKYTGQDGKVRTSGKETFFNSRGGSQGIEVSFERFIRLIENTALDSNGS